MEVETNGSESKRSRSFSWTGSSRFSLRRHSFSSSNAVPPQNDDGLDSESVSEAGDIGDRALHSNRYCGSGSLRLSVDNIMENGSVVPLPDGALMQSYPSALTTASPVTLSTMEIISALPTEEIILSDDKKQENKKELPWLLDYSLCLIHLAVFGILGVLTRYALRKLFGPGGIGVTSDKSPLYLDLPSNMVGSFLMGWWGVVFKGDISRVSNYLAIGLTTGYLGSLTTFSGWNQKMLDLSVQGKWVYVLLGFLIGRKGLFLALISIMIGVKTAQCFRWLLRKLNVLPLSGLMRNWKVDNFKFQFAVMVVLLSMLGLLWGICGAFEKREFQSGGSGAQLWLACIVGPFGVWIRWFLARLNGRGLGKSGLLKWVPFGTLIANVSAACVMAALATLQKAVKTENCYTVVIGIQFGFLGCLSTVSTLMAEVHAMLVSKQPWRAFVYALTTVVMSFSFGTLIYSVPVWFKGYN